MDENASSPRFTNFPLIWLAICFATGIFIAGILPITIAIVAFCAGVLIVATAVVRHRYSLIFVSITFLATGALSYLLHQDNLSADRLKRVYDEGQIVSGEPMEIVGTLTGNREATIDGFFMTVEAEQLIYKSVIRPVSGRLRIFASSNSELINAEFAALQLESGAKIRVACNPVREDSYQNPGVLPRKELLDWQNLDATATLKSPLLIEMLGDRSAWNPNDYIYALRENLISEYREHFSISTSGVMIASLFGNKHFLDKSSAEVFREGGTFHILIISGLHITFMGGFVLLMVGVFTGNRLIQFLIVCSFLWIYTVAVGAEVPVVRASIMFTILLFSRVIYRTGTLVNSLGACALILLIWRPQDLFSPSFQLTFVSVAAIVIAAFPLIEMLRSIGDWSPTIGRPFPPNVPRWLKIFCETLYWREAAWEIEAKRNIWSARLFKSPVRRISASEPLRRATAFIFEGILVSIIVQLWLFPFLVVYFHRVSSLSVLLNLWAGVFIALESFSSLIAICLSLFSDTLALPMIELTELLNWLLIAFPRIFVESDWAGFRLPAYTGWASAIYAAYLLPVIALGHFIYNWNPFALSGDRSNRHLTAKKARSLTRFAILSGLLIIFHPFSAPIPDGRLHIDFLDVGQGDSALITFPTGETMLVDGGGRVGYKKTNTFEDFESESFEPDVPGIGESVVSEFLWEKGYSKIDYIVATHADADHIQGLNDVAKNFNIGAALIGRTPTSDPEYVKFADVVKRRKIPEIIVNRGDRLSIGGVLVEVLYPAAIEDPNAISDNDQSVVLRLVMGNRSFLLTGDIESRAEAELLSHGGSLAADLVKVPHHGSRTSSTQAFVNTVGADYAVMSVGNRSVFSHPHQEVVKRWQAAGASVMTTGERGTISISTDGKEFVIKTYLP